MMLQRPRRFRRAFGGCDFRGRGVWPYPEVLVHVRWCIVRVLWVLWTGLLNWGDLRTKPPWRGPALAFLLLLGCCAAQKSPAGAATGGPGPPPPKVCGNIDIRNSVHNMERLAECEVVEGNLQLVLITNGTASINAVSFPKLREVTGFVVLWHVNGLRSLGTLFPNLAVIRGRTLFENYALVAYEMRDLVEVGIHSLSSILRGSVRIDKNTRLCYVDTLDWNVIAPNGANGHVIKDNRPKSECSKCHVNTSVGCINHPEPLCWNKDHCQKLGNCYENGLCCHENCVGGCTGPSSSECLVCKDLLLNGECIKQCPPNTYKYLDRRCVTAEECFSMRRPNTQTAKRPRFPFRPIQGECVLECPPGFVETEVKVGDRFRYPCHACEGPCKKECMGGMVDSIAAAQTMAGCTHIIGQGLEIQLHSGASRNLARELENSLGSIEEIDGYLKVVRSFPLVSLNFLKSLRVIHGKKLDNHNSSFVLLDNQNLQDLWDFSEKRLSIRNGNLFFHFNPRLCFDKIEKLRDTAGLAEFTELEVPRDSNGDKEACNVTRLHVEVGLIRSLSAIIKWEPFKNHDPRTLLGYVVSYVRAPYKNITYYDGRDACGGDGWTVDDVPVPPVDLTEPRVTYVITSLEPNTQYAVYLKTCTIKYETNGGLSNITYLTTAPGTPSKPNFVVARANSSSEMVITWSPPTAINGELEYYVVTGKMEEDQMPLDRDFCADPLVISPLEPPARPPPTPPPHVAGTDECSCNQTQRVKPKETDEARQDVISFENALQNYFYVKRQNANGMKRSVPHDEKGRELNGLLADRDTKAMDMPEPDVLAFEKRVTNGTQLVVRDLHHFTGYTISVQACRKPWTGGVDSTKACSVTMMVYERTKKNESADAIPEVHLYHQVINETTITRLKWTQPRQPNGLVHSYKIERTRTATDKESKLPDCVARPLGHTGPMEYTMRNLEPGNYSSRVRAVSLAGPGPYSRLVWIRVAPGGRGGGAEAWVGVVLALLLIALFVGAFVIYWRHVPKLIPTVNVEYIITAPGDEWEVDRDKVELIRQLGRGNFGMVYEGVARGLVDGQPRVRCAVKTVNEAATDHFRQEFLYEAAVMKTFNTHHVVRLLGVVSESQPMLLIMELMSSGDLKAYLRNHRPETALVGQVIKPLTLKSIMRMAVEIADGMAYLTAKKFVHRDLAARNCMVADDLTIKIGDFGLTRDIYETDYYKKGTNRLLPVRWMAPESLKDGLFQSSSDVWSYGVVLWEIVTLASQPYFGLSNGQVFKYVIEGGVMERPENCPDKLYHLMSLCWLHKPTLRPSFLDLVTRLLPDVSDSFESVSFYHSPEGSEIRAHLQETQAAELEASFGAPLTALRASPEDVDDSEDLSSVCSASDADGEDGPALPLLPPVLVPQPVTSSSDSSRGNGSALLNGYVPHTANC